MKDRGAVREPMSLKTVLISTRVTPTIRVLVEREASRQGITPSEWLRKLILTELEARDLLQPTEFV